jgi:peptide/nickel transport system permease protein
MVGSVMFVALGADWLTPFQYDQMRAGGFLQSPSLRYPFGTDAFGRDVWTRVIHGSRVSLQVAAIISLLSAAVGIPLGLLSGYARGHLDHVLMAVADLLFTVPSVLMALVVAAVLGPGLTTVMVGLSIVYMPQYMRLTRGLALSLAQRDFVLAARTLGASPGRIILRAVFPNCAAPLVVLTALVMSYAILAEVTLSFLGIGTQPPTPSWGLMLLEGVETMYRAPLLAVFPGLAVTYLVLGFNLLGDSLRDIWDPYVSRR